MIKELVTDDAILSQRCEPATADDAELAQDLLDTLASLDDAACLAANQIGVTKAMFAYVDEKDRARVMCNPHILLGLAPAQVVEGCLTREEEQRVKRFAKVKVKYQELVDGKLVNRQADFLGWMAQVVQHMVDHCNGKLI
ncbi:peptide deformylase [Atopobiaceae bacterium SGI.236]|nr:peptide deformylase [Atopobiaceae bacterium]